MTAQGVDQLFDFSEDKEGYFWAHLKPKQWLDKAQFKTMCALARDLGGEGYLKGAKAWKVPGPCVKKPDTTSTPAEDARSKTEPSGVTPHVVSQDKSKPPQFTVPIKALLSLPFQSRHSLEGPGLDELAENMKFVGLLHPIVVRAKPSGLYEIVTGERRVAAAKKLGWIEISANIKILSDEEAYETQFSENIHREDLSDMEKARWLDFMIKKFGHTQEALAQKVGKSKAWVSQHIAMLELEKVHPGELQTGELTERQAREILAAPEEKREEIIDQINETGEIPSAREIRRAVQPEQLSEPLGPQPEPEESPKPLLTGFEVECPECHVKLLINHVDHPNGKVTHEVEE
jgi:ParB family chromosome partitioning protein